MKTDHYRILEVPRDASVEAIQHAYRNPALRYHPDRNSAADAASRMTLINEAWKVLGDPERRRDYDQRLSRPNLHPEFATSILLAAREMLQRGGWRVQEDTTRMIVLEKARRKVRVAFLDRVDNAILSGLARQSSEFCVALSIRVDGPIGSSATAIDLLHSERHGAVLPDEPEASCRALFAVFL